LIVKPGQPRITEDLIVSEGGEIHLVLGAEEVQWDVRYVTPSSPGHLKFGIDELRKADEHI
jgi:hypothetical protein